MRKLYILFSLVIIVFIINFSIWFWETKVINDVITELQRQMALSGIEIGYSDIKYSTFRSWQVNGHIEHLRIKYGKSQKNVIEIPILKFYTKPFSNNIEFSLIEEALWSNQLSQEAYRIEYKDMLNPKLTFEFQLSFSEFLSILRDPARKPIYTFIKHLQFSSPAFKVIETTSNSPYFSGKEIFLDLLSTRDDKSRNFNINFSFNDLLFNENYSPKSEAKKAQNALDTALGAISAVFQIEYKEHPSKKQMEYLKKLDNPDIKPIFDSYQIDIVNLNTKSSLFATDIKGNVTKQPEDIMLPSFDISINISNYMNLFNYYIDGMNIILGEIENNKGGSNKIKITDEKREALKQIIALFKPQGDNLSLQLTKKNNNDIMISDVPLFSLIMQIEQAINKLPDTKEQDQSNNPSIKEQATINKPKTSK